MFYVHYIKLGTHSLLCDGVTTEKNTNELTQIHPDLKIDPISKVCI